MSTTAHLPLWQWSATSLATAIREKRLSSQDVIQAHLNRIEAVNPIVNAVTVVLKEDALRAASKADKTIAAGEDVGQLHGVPITVKEAFDVVGSATTHGIVALKDSMPMRYGVVLDFETAKKARNGYVNFDTLRDEPSMIIRAGGIGPLAAYIDKAKKRNNTEKMGSSHNHNSINPNQPQTRILKLGGSKGGKGSDGSDQGLGRGYDTDWGISAGGLVDFARYVAVAPHNVSTDLQYLDFEL